VKLTKLKFIIFAAILVMAILYLTIINQPKETSLQIESSPPTSNPEINEININDEIFKNALNLYAQKKLSGADISSGPCLGPIGQNWVLDLVNNPRNKAIATTISIIQIPNNTVSKVVLSSAITNRYTITKENFFCNYIKAKNGSSCCYWINNFSGCF